MPICKNISRFRKCFPDFEKMFPRILKIFLRFRKFFLSFDFFFPIMKFFSWFWKKISDFEKVLFEAPFHSFILTFYFITFKKCFSLSCVICFRFVLLHLFYIFNITHHHRKTKYLVDDGRRDKKNNLYNEKNFEHDKLY